MFLDSDDFKSVWELAHNWIGEDTTKTESESISADLKVAIHRLLHAIANHEISARTRNHLILEDNSFWTFILDSRHLLKFFWCLKRNKFDEYYLNSLYVKRYEVINWCRNVAFLDLPPCWVSINATSNQAVKNSAIRSRTTKEKRLQQQHAAHQRHKPVDDLKKACILYWLENQSSSNIQTAKKFYKLLSSEQQKLLSSTNAPNTFAKAISDYRNRDELTKKNNLPYWLINFNPEIPQK